MVYLKNGAFKLKTKQKIINQAILHYNKFGVSNVTSRDLAQTLEISHGNLEYHFKNKEALLKAIYLQMREEISEVYKERGESVDPFLHFNELLTKLEIFHSRYSFFNLDVLEISRNYAKVDQLLKRTFQIRKEQMAHFYQQFMEYGYLKEEMHPGMYSRLQHTIRILITFWKSQEVVVANFNFDKKGEMVRHIWDLLLPHFTAKGIAEYENVLKNFSKPLYAK